MFAEGRKNVRVIIFAGLVYSGLCMSSGAVYGTPVTEAPWMYMNGDNYEAEVPRVEDLQPPVSREEQREVVEGAVRTVDNAAEEVTETVGEATEAVVPPPPPQNIIAGAGAVVVNAVEAVAGAVRVVFGAIFE